MKPLDRLLTARKIYVDMLARETNADTRSILTSNIAALDRKIETLTKERAK